MLSQKSRNGELNTVENGTFQLRNVLMTLGAPNLPTGIAADVTSKDSQNAILRHCEASYKQLVSLAGKEKANEMMAAGRKA